MKRRGRGTGRDPWGQWVLLLLAATVLGTALLLHGFAQGTLGETAHAKKGAPGPASVQRGGPVIDLSGAEPRTMRMPAKTIALTFDDGPDPKWTPKLLDVLKKHNAKATFFVVGARVAEHPEIVRRMLREGHEVGSHTFSHADMGTAVPRREQLELSLTERALAGAAGIRPRLWRPPYSSTPDAVTAPEFAAAYRAARDGYLLVLTDRDTRDWQRPGIAEIVRRATAEKRAGEGAVVMLHDSGGPRDQTVAAVEQILGTVKGYRFATVSEALALERSEVAARERDERFGTLLLRIQESSGVLLAVLAVLCALTAALTLIRLAMLVVVGRVHRRRARKRGPLDPWPEPVTIVVPAFNEESSIAATIRSLLATDHPAPVEVIVIDDGSRDRTAEIVAEMSRDLRGLRLIRKVNGGKPSALNAGIEAASHEIVVMVDGDTVFQRDTLAELLRPFANPKVGAVSGNTKVANRRGLIGTWQHLEYVTGFNLDRRLYDLLGCMPTIPGAIGAFRRSALLQVGGVSTTTLAEDTDLSLAICRAGHEVAYAEKAIAWTEAPNSLRQLWRQRYRWCYGTLQAIWKHRGARGRIGLLALPYVLLFQVLLPLIAPAVDVFVLYGLFVLDPSQVIAYYLMFTLAQALAVGYALRLDGERRRTLWSLPLQQIVYRQLMYGVVLQSVTAAMLGSRLRWHALDRTGTFATPTHLPSESPAALPPPVDNQVSAHAQELALLRTSLKSAVAGSPQLIVLESPASSGLSALLTQLTNAPAFQVALTRCHPLQQNHGYATLRRLLPAPPADLEERGLADRVLADTVERHALGESGALRDAARYGLWKLVEARAKLGPVLFVVDDAQWADRASLEWFSYLAERWDGLPIAVVLGLAGRGRPDLLEGGNRLSEVAMRVPLTPLTQKEATALLWWQAAPEFVAACLELGSGSPYLMAEIEATVQARGMAPDAKTAARLRRDTLHGPEAPGSPATPQVLRVVLERIHRAGPEAVDLARAYAVSSEPADTQICLALAHARPGTVRTLIDLRVFRADGSRVVHPLLREAILGELTPERRKSWHRKAARTFYDLDPGNTEEIAAHVIAGDLNDEPWVLDVLADAARLAQHRGALAEACAHLERTARLLPPEDRSSVLFQMAQIQSHFDPAASHGTLRDALQGATGTTRAKIQAALHPDNLPNDLDETTALRLKARTIWREKQGPVKIKGSDWRARALSDGMLPDEVPDAYDDQVLVWVALRNWPMSDESRLFAAKAVEQALERGWLDQAAEGMRLLGADARHRDQLEHAVQWFTKALALERAIGKARRNGVGPLAALLVELERDLEAEDLLEEAGLLYVPDSALNGDKDLVWARARLDQRSS